MGGEGRGEERRDQEEKRDIKERRKVQAKGGDTHSPNALHNSLGPIKKLPKEAETMY